MRRLDGACRSCHSSWYDTTSAKAVMVMDGKNEDLELLRQQVRNITSEIMRNVQKRMELAKQIGDLKSRLGIDVKDEKVEEEIRSMVTKLADEIGMSNDF